MLRISIGMKTVVAESIQETIKNEKKWLCAEKERKSDDFS